MSGLAALLAGREPAGVRRWDDVQAIDDLRHTVERAGWRFGWVDGWIRAGKREVLSAIGEALGFPEHYGRNLDALADCLGDLTDDVVLVWDGWSVLAGEDRAAFDLVLRVLAGSPGSPRVAVLLRGGGPELTAAPLLD